MLATDIITESNLLILFHVCILSCSKDCTTYRSPIQPNDCIFISPFNSVSSFSIYVLSCVCQLSNKEYYDDDQVFA